MNISMMATRRSLALATAFALGANGLYAQTAPVCDQAYPELVNARAKASPICQPPSLRMRC